MNGFLLFHSIVEASSIVIAGSIFMTVWNTRTYRIKAASTFLVIGIGFLFVGILDLMHTLAYKGMNVFPAYDTNLPTQLWIAARYLQGLTLLGAALQPLLQQHRHKHLHARAAYELLAGYAAVTALLLLATFSRHFPACYVMGAGLTPFKRISEYVICVILAGAGVFVWRARNYFSGETVVYFMAAIVTSILSELSFTLYTDVYGAFNIIGHVLKIIAFALLYKCIVQTNLQSLGESERRFRLLFENLPDGYAVHEIIVDRQGQPCDYRFLEVNPAYEELTGLKARDIIGRTVLQVLPDVEPEWIQRYGQVALGGDPVRFDMFARALDKHFEVSAYSPMPRQFATVVLDITERKKMEEQLRDSENRLRAVFDQAAIGVALLNTKTGQYVQVNQRYCDFLGYTMEEMLQKTLIDVTFREDVQQNIEANAQLIDGTRKEFSYEKRYVRKDGSIVWGNLTISPLWKPGEKPATYFHIAVVEDITERKKMEEERVLLQEQLLRARKLEAVGQLAGGVAHNFNNLLTGIMGSIEIAHMDIPPTSPATASLENAQAAAVKAADLARKLLSFSRNAMIAPAVEHANVLVESALELVSSSLPGSLEIIRDLSPDAWDVVMDGPQFTHVLMELVTNAREAMQDGGTVTIRTRNAAIHDDYVASHPYAHTGDFVVISVGDTGPGIDPAITEHLFEPFATTKQFGRGMGLASVFGSVKQEGGWLDVSSGPGAGTEISLYLPRYFEQH